MKKYIWLFAALTFVLSSCHHFFGKRVHGNGVVKSEEHSVSSFKNLEVDGSINVYLSQGDTKPVKVETDENLLQFIEVYQEGEKVIVRERSGFNLNPTNEIKIYVTAPVYNRIEVSGASDIVGQGKITNTENMDLSTSGAGDINLDIDAPQLKIHVSGSGSVDLKGQTKDLDLSMSGAGDAHCYGLLSENTKVHISGAGSAEVFASVKLDAEVSGVGSVTYKGNAPEVSQHVSGVGSVSKAN